MIAVAKQTKTEKRILPSYIDGDLSQSRMRSVRPLGSFAQARFEQKSWHRRFLR